MKTKHNKENKLREVLKYIRWGFIAWTLILFTLFIALTTEASAKQLSFSKLNKGKTTQFSYTWQNEGAHYSLVFELNNQALLNTPDSPANYNESLLQDYVYSEVLRVASQVDPSRAKVNIKREPQGLSFNVKSRQNNYANEIMMKLKSTHANAQQRYWDKAFITSYSAPNGQTGIRHDHARYTKLSASALKPIIKSIKQMQVNPNDSREFISILMSWIQTIPYSRLENRLYLNGAGFVAPRDLLYSNQGDCDSKSTLMAAVLKAYSQTINLQMVYLPEHALLALAMPAKPSESTIIHNGIQFVLLEPTGPAQYKIGEVAESTNLAILNRQYDLTPL